MNEGLARQLADGAAQFPAQPVGIAAADRTTTECDPRAASAWRHRASGFRPGSAGGHLRCRPGRRWACGRSRPAPAGSRAPPPPRSPMLGTDEFARAGSRVCQSSARQVMASAPWPGAGGIVFDIDRARWRDAAGPAGSVPPAPDRWRRSRRSVDPPQPRLDAAAQGHDFQVRPQMQGLGLAAQAGGAHHRAVAASPSSSGALGEMKASRGIFPRRHRRQHDAVAACAVGRSFMRMDGGVDAPVQQGFVQLLGEQALAAGILQPAIGDAVAAGDEALDRDGSRPRRSAAPACAATRRDLRQRQRRAARAQLQHHGHSATGGMDDRMLSTLPPVFSPKVVPRS